MLVRAPEEQPHPREHQGAQRDQGEVVLREIVAADGDGAVEPGGPRAEHVLGPPYQERCVLDDEHDPERRDQKEQLRSAVDAAQDHELDQHPDDADGQRREQERDPETEHASSDGLHDGERQVSAEHVEGPVREVEDPRDAEDDGKARGDQEERGGVGQPGEELHQKEAHVPAIGG